MHQLWKGEPHEGAVPISSSTLNFSAMESFSPNMPNLIDLRMRDLSRGLSSAAWPSEGSAVAARAKPPALAKSLRLS